jgi:AICAR transformylase/IMP cyclohydrolase PurH
MGREKFAFVSAKDKAGLSELAVGLDASGHRIVSLGGTAIDLRKKTSIDVIESQEFINDPRLADLAEGLSEREARQLYAFSLGIRMSHKPKDLAREGLFPIEATYINLMPPVFDDPNFDGVKNDKGGVYMISASIEGRRPIITSPEQIPELISQYKKVNGPTELEKMSWGEQASRSLAKYATRTSRVGKAALSQV